MFKRTIKYVILLTVVILPVSCGLFTDISIDRTPAATASNSNANLSGLTLSVGSLSPAFSENTTVYTSQVTYDTSSITVTPVAAGTGAYVRVNSVDATSGSPFSITGLVVGSTNIITVTVRAQDGTTKEYTVTVTRLEATKANLSALSVSAGVISPAFNALKTSYIVYAYSGTTTTVTPVVFAAGATVTVNGTPVASGSPSSSITLNTGAYPANITNIVVSVTSADTLLTKVYQVKIYRISSPVRVGYWPLFSDLENKDNPGAYGTWMGSWGGAGAPADLGTALYVAENGKTGVHFRYAADGLYVTGGLLYDINNVEIPLIEQPVTGNWVNCEDSGHQAGLYIEDYISVSLWFFWDSDLMRDYKGNTIPEGSVINNIISKSVFWNYGWQIRHEQNWDGNPGSIVYLYLHNSGKIEQLPIITNFSEHRGEWVNIIVTIDNVNNEVFTYVNGVETSSSPQTYGAQIGHYLGVPIGYTHELDYTGHLAIGAFSHPWGGYSVNGKMRDVRIYHGLIDSAAALAIYNSEKP